MGDRAVLYSFRTASKEDFPQILDFRKETGKHVAIHCLESWLEIDPEFCQIAVTEKGEILGVCCAAIHNEDLAFVGFYDVKDECRGQGIGFKLWKACLDHIGDRNAAVNAVPNMVMSYKNRGGFPEEETEWSCQVFETQNGVDVSNLRSDVPDVNIMPISEKILPKIVNYDDSVVGYKRGRILRLTVQEAESAAFAAVDAKKEVRGYGVLRRSVQGNGLVGPLYADSPNIAGCLLRKMLHSSPYTEKLAMISLDSNPGVTRIAKDLGLVERHRKIRCYKKARIHADLSKIFCLWDISFSPF